MPQATTQPRSLYYNHHGHDYLCKRENIRESMQDPRLTRQTDNEVDFG